MSSPVSGVGHEIPVFLSVSALGQVLVEYEEGQVVH
jgi:hypothetical protein